MVPAQVKLTSCMFLAITFFNVILVGLISQAVRNFEHLVFTQNQINEIEGVGQRDNTDSSEGLL